MQKVDLHHTATKHKMQTMCINLGMNFIPSDFFPCQTFYIDSLYIPKDGYVHICPFARLQKLQTCQYINKVLEKLGIFVTKNSVIDVLILIYNDWNCCNSRHVGSTGCYSKRLLTNNFDTNDSFKIYSKGITWECWIKVFESTIITSITLHIRRNCLIFLFLNCLFIP